MRVAPGGRPEWVHREYTWTIPAAPHRGLFARLFRPAPKPTVYTFRTLSLYDVWNIWPHLAPLLASIDHGKPLAFSDRLTAILEVINPPLLAAINSGEVKEVAGVLVDGLLEFYGRQDWKRISELAKETEPSDTISKEEAVSNFVVVCVAAARFAGMNVAEFGHQRFEFCADAIVATYKTTQEREAEGHLTSGQFLTVMSSVLPKVDGADVPAWVEDLNKRGSKVPN